MKVEANMIKDIKFEGRGCAISQASASQLTEMVINKPMISVMNLSKGDIFENMGLTNLGPARVKCALLSLKVLKMGVVRYYTDMDPNLAKELENQDSVY
ncbi:MAG: iron-sulfur cluster assembly scaffold protein [Candidatus Nitrosopolaris sp.]